MGDPGWHTLQISTHAIYYAVFLRILLTETMKKEIPALVININGHKFPGNYS
jgi:hypothetical protein